MKSKFCLVFGRFILNIYLSGSFRRKVLKAREAQTFVINV